MLKKAFVENIEFYDMVGIQEIERLFVMDDRSSGMQKRLKRAALSIS